LDFATFQIYSVSINTPLTASIEVTLAKLAFDHYIVNMDLLTVDKVPFVLAFLLGLLGYQINRVAEATVNTRAIEYDFEVLDEKDTSGMVERYNQCTITNITGSTSFEGLTINMMYDETSSSSIYSPDIIPVTPSSLHNINFGELNDIIVEYNIERLQPSFLYRLTFKTLTARDAKFPKLFLTTNTSVRLIEASMATWLAKKYLSVNFILIIIWLLLVAAYVIYIRFFNTKVKKDESPPDNRSLKYGYRYLPSTRVYNKRPRRR
jgi:hypothetical protein